MSFLRLAKCLIDYKKKTRSGAENSEKRFNRSLRRRGRSRHVNSRVPNLGMTGGEGHLAGATFVGRRRDITPLQSHRYGSAYSISCFTSNEMNSSWTVVLR